MTYLKQVPLPNLSKQNRLAYVKYEMKSQTLDELVVEFKLLLSRLSGQWINEWQDKNSRYPSSVGSGIQGRMNRMLKRHTDRIKSLLEQSNGNVIGYYRKALSSHVGKERNVYHNGGHPLTFNLNLVEEAELEEREQSDGLNPNTRVARHIKAVCEDWVIDAWRKINWNELIDKVNTKNQFYGHVSEATGLTRTEAKQFAEKLAEKLAQRRHDIGKKRRRAAAEKARRPMHNTN